MTKIVYLVPDTEPIPDPATCAPCGQFVRRGVPWHLSASDSAGGAHVVRMVQSGKDAPDIVDQHTVYMKSKDTPYYETWYGTVDNGTLYVSTYNLIGSPVSWTTDDIFVDIYINPEQYTIDIDGNTIVFDRYQFGTALFDDTPNFTYYEQFKVGINAQLWSDNYQQVTTGVYRSDVRIYKNGSLVAHTQFTVNTNLASTKPSAPAIGKLVTINNIVNDWFLE